MVEVEDAGEAEVYDLVVDTTRLAPEECAAEIGRVLKEGRFEGFGRVGRELMGAE